MRKILDPPGAIKAFPTTHDRSQSMTSLHSTPHRPRQEHSVPWFWPMAAAIELGEQGLAMFRDNMRYVEEAEKIAAPPKPVWATKNRVLLDLDTMRVRDFSPPGHQPTRPPVLIDAPYAGHSSTIADYAVGQSLVETMQSAGLAQVLVTDWKSATSAMKNYDIDNYLADIDTAVEHLGGVVDLVGLCQGGWMSSMYTARFPAKVRSLVLAGAPIDTDAGDGAIKTLAHQLPLGFY
jgi:poly(3-hydroxybutyrate) depolymerase